MTEHDAPVLEMSHTQVTPADSASKLPSTAEECQSWTSSFAPAERTAWIQLM